MKRDTEGVDGRLFVVPFGEQPQPLGHCAVRQEFAVSGGRNSRNRRTTRAAIAEDIGEPASTAYFNASRRRAAVPPPPYMGSVLPFSYTISAVQQFSQTVSHSSSSTWLW